MHFSSWVRNTVQFVGEKSMKLASVDELYIRFVNKECAEVRDLETHYSVCLSVRVWKIQERIHYSSWVSKECLSVRG